MTDKRENFLAKCLLEAIEDENISNVKTLLFKHKANPSCVDKERGIAPIHYAAGMDNVIFSDRVMILMLKNNGDPNVRTVDGETPLHVAASWNRQFIVEMLLDHGADCLIEDDEHNTAINYAILEGHHELIEVFKKHIFEKKLEGKHQDISKMPKKETPTKQRQAIMKSSKNLEVPQRLQTTADNIYTPNRKHYNFDVSSPYYIHITQRRKDTPNIGFKDTFSLVESKQITVDPLIASQQEKTTKNINKTDVSLAPTTETGTTTDTYSGSNETMIFKGNLFQLTEKNLSKHLESFKKMKRVSLVDTWRNKVHKFQQRKSILPSDEDELESVIRHFDETLASTKTSTPFINRENVVIANKSNNHLDINGVTGDEQTETESFVTAQDDASNDEEKRFIKSPNKNAMIQVENFIHTDAEKNIVFYETKFHPAPKSVSGSGASNLDGSQCSASSKPLTDITLPLEYDTDDLRKELTAFGASPGPITKSTKRLYLQKLIRYKKQTKAIDIDNNGLNNRKFSIELERTLRPENKDKWQVLIAEYKSLEIKMAEGFQNDNQGKRFREGNLKTSFIYLLIDPRVSENLPIESQMISKFETWQRFVPSIFYVGKGKSSRPYAHLYDAIKIHHGSQVDVPKGKHSESEKIDRIISIWNAGKGVVCLPVFHNILPVEAYTREASIIDCIGIQNLANLKRGDYYGHSMSWTMRQRKQLGILLLYKAMHIFLIQGESQLRSDDIKKD